MLLAKFFFKFHAPVQKCHFGKIENCQNGTFEPKHEIQKFFLPKDFFRGIMKVPITKNIHNFFQGLSNPGFRSVKVQIDTFLKKDSRDFKNSFQFRFLWIPSKTGEQNQKVLILWWFIVVERQCDLPTPSANVICESSLN